MQPHNVDVDYEGELQNIFNRFFAVAKQLQRRHDNRDTLSIKDEYDVQDLLNSLLLLHFEDVRPEEWTPSYAGGSKRMDFLLKDSEIAIEVKMTRIAQKYDNHTGTSYEECEVLNLRLYEGIKSNKYE